LGKLIRQKQEAGELARREDNLKHGPEVPEGNIGKQTISETGITKKESSTSKNLAAVPDEEFEEGIQASLPIENTRQTLPDIGITWGSSSDRSRRRGSWRQGTMDINMGLVLTWNKYPQLSPISELLARSPADFRK
jgi:hypothetical protein